MKDDSGSHAVCTQQGSPASHVRVAKVLDVISRLPGCARVSAYSQVKMEDAPKLLGLSEAESSTIWIILSKSLKAWINTIPPEMTTENRCAGFYFYELIKTRNICYLMRAYFLS